jgi:hypothetical protein
LTNKQLTMHLNTIIPVKGCITQEKFSKGRTLAEIERLLGFHTGRLQQGMIVTALTQIPQVGQFEFGGYSQVASHHFQEQYGKVAFDKDMMKKKLVSDVFKIQGPDRLVKVMANIRHNDAMLADDQYPPGRGIPQWVLTTQISAQVIALINDYPHGRFL